MGRLSDTEAAQRLAAGDTSALDVLYATHAETALRTAYLITRNRAEAEDVVQEAFVQVIRNIAALRNPASFRSWFYRIVVNRAKRYARYRDRSIHVDLAQHDRVDLAALAPDEAAIGTEETERMRALIAELPDTHREPVILRYYTCLSDEEIAKALGLPAGTVKSRLHRAREALLKRMAATDKDGPSTMLRPRSTLEGVNRT